VSAKVPCQIGPTFSFVVLIELHYHAFTRVENSSMPSFKPQPFESEVKGSRNLVGRSGAQ
jgi:hypothetical protein